MVTPLQFLGILFLVGLVSFTAVGAYTTWELRKARRQAEGKTPVEFRAPCVNTPLEEAIIELDRVDVQLRALNVGLATVHLANCFVHLQDVGEEEKIPINGRVQALAVMVRKMAEAMLAKRDGLLQEVEQGRTTPLP